MKRQGVEVIIGKGEKNMKESAYLFCLNGIYSQSMALNMKGFVLNIFMANYSKT